MKTRVINSFLTAIVFATLNSTFPSRAGSALNLVLPTLLTNGSLTITDPTNQTWILYSSSNLLAWNTIGVWKVYNGSFFSSLTNKLSSGSLFYRATFDPASQTNLDTTTAALLLPASLYNYANPSLPANYLVAPIVTEDNTPTNNPVTDLGAELGRVLFYDKRLSTNQTIACASCHQQKNGFADSRTLSVGFNGSLGTRNAMGLTQARYYQRGHFFWDERATTLELQTLQPIQNPVEMGMTLPTLVARLATEPFYTNLFTEVFGTPDVTTNRISFALAQFVRSMISTNSKYDLGVKAGFTNFTTQENLGRQIFFGQTGNATCSACHSLDTFSAANIFNNGLEYPYVDTGVGGITGRAQDQGLFKVPSLRNIGLTAPYMHDGRFATLTQVVNFYSSNIVFNPNLSPPLRAGAPNSTTPLRLNLTAAQQTALIAFLNTLTDTNFVSDPRFSDPFNYGN